MEQILQSTYSLDNFIANFLVDRWKSNITKMDWAVTYGMIHGVKMLIALDQVEEHEVLALLRDISYERAFELE